MSKMLGCLVGLLAAGWLIGCEGRGRGEEALPEPPQSSLPAHFPAPVYTFGSHTPLTPQGFELGRMLFYDPRLSRDGTVSCGSCHQPAFAFADSVRATSLGVGAQSGVRNTPGLANLAWMPAFFWDGGAAHLEITPLNALTNPVEMGETLQHTLEKLNATPRYREKFKAAFGEDTISAQLLFRAIAQFTGSLVSDGSRYDRYVRQERGAALTADEREGLQLFTQKCANCHATHLFTDHSFRNNGLDGEGVRDPGRQVVTGNAADRGKFKVPSLRNVALTPPYMHDGRFPTLAAVLDHYAAGVQNSSTLDPLLRQAGAPGIPLTEAEKTKLIAFLHTLTDATFCADERFKDPGSL